MLRMPLKFHEVSHASLRDRAVLRVQASGLMPRSFVDDLLMSGSMLLRLLQMASLHSDRRKDRGLFSVVLLGCNGSSHNTDLR